MKFILSIILFVIVPSNAEAQSTDTATRPTGTVSGQLLYGDIPIPDATVLLSEEYIEFETISIDNGTFVFPGVPARLPFKLSAAKFGYKTHLLPDSIHLEQDETKSYVMNLRRGFLDDCEYDQGWSFGVEGEGASGGQWMRAIPLGSREGAYTVQIFDDSEDEGKYCFVTGNAETAEDPAGTADVDGGPATLRTPIFDLADLVNPVLTFSYYYSNDRGPQRGGDFFKIQISNDSGENWTNLIQTSASTQGWTNISINLKDFIVVTKTMLLQFIAEDNAPSSLVEAAVDQVSITGEPGVPEPPRELVLDVQFNRVILRWRPSEGASLYNVYLSGVRGDVIRPENLYSTVSDTTLTVPLSEITHDEFYFKVTAVR